MTGRRRGGSFHEEIDSPYGADLAIDIQFMTPNYQHDSTGPEPMDTKLRLNLDGDLDDGEEEEGDEDDEESEQEEDERYSRGRSRSRSVNEYDDNANEYFPEGIDNPVEAHNTAESIILRAGGGNEMPPLVPLNSKGERTGPLQSREVAALQKVLFNLLLADVVYHDLCFTACLSFYIGIGRSNTVDE
jgi:hypothetical protein